MLSLTSVITATTVSYVCVCVCVSCNVGLKTKDPETSLAPRFLCSAVYFPLGSQECKFFFLKSSKNMNNGTCVAFRAPEHHSDEFKYRRCLSGKYADAHCSSCPRGQRTPDRGTDRQLLRPPARSGSTPGYLGQTLSARDLRTRNLVVFQREWLYGFGLSFLNTSVA